LWHSPYNRTRQTAQEIYEACTLPKEAQIFDSPNHDVLTSTIRREGTSFFFDKKEHFLLYEQQHGIYDGLSDDERKEQYPEEWAYYQKHKRDGGKVFAQLPLGESRIDVAQRIHQAFGTFHRDADKHGIEDIVVVGHGTTNRCFLFAWLHKTYEWLEKEPNPKNCSVRLIEDGKDEGYIYEGAEHPDGFIHDHTGADGQSEGDTKPRP
jgi:2,3-bisphosphoglycerate-dependent phosphoglycerate mutase